MMKSAENKSFPGIGTVRKLFWFPDFLYIVLIENIPIEFG